MSCRNCFSGNLISFLNLFSQPLSNAMIPMDKIDVPEPYYPLEVFVCNDCHFVQIFAHGDPKNIFDEDYVYYSSANKLFVEHARQYVNNITDLLTLDENSFVVEAASNDGYLLQHFRDKGIPHLGVEPTGCAEAAEKIGVRTLRDFFTTSNGKKIAENYGKADLFLGNNVLAHVPDLNDFVGGIASILKDSGVATLEFPHLLKMMQQTQFDTVYHEHYSYISYYSVRKTFERHGLEIFRIDEIPVHGGSLRLYAAPKVHGRPVEASVAKVLADEQAAGLDALTSYKNFQNDVEILCREFTQFVLQAKAEGKTIWGFGAAAKGNTFLNYCGIKANLIDAIADDTLVKQGRLSPGSRIPVKTQEDLKAAQPDYVVILPWNWREAIEVRLDYISDWGGKFVVAIPKFEVITPLTCQQN